MRRPASVSFPFIGAAVRFAMGLGFGSAVFDNIPLTALVLKQGGYDWRYVAFAVGFGGSMIWFGSSAGVALSSQYPQAKSAIAWVRVGWPVTVAYVLSYLFMIAMLGWHPDVLHRAATTTPDGVRAAATMSPRTTGAPS